MKYFQRTVGGFFHADGTPLKMDSVYTVLTTDYLYARSDYNYSLNDTDPYSTGINYYQSTITYLESLGTTAATPLDGYLDLTARR